jgi:ketosteroid isomerase-like protein
MNTREVVKKYFQYVNEGNWDAWLTLFDENIVMDEQLAGHLEGIEVLRGAVGGLKRGYSKFQNNPLKILIDGEDAMIKWEIDAANASGVPIKAKGVNQFIVKNGKITYMANFHDSVPFKPFTEQKFEVNV